MTQVLADVIFNITGKTVDEYAKTEFNQKIEKVVDKGVQAILL